MSERKTRVSKNRETNSKDGSYSARIKKRTAERLKDYCRTFNLAKDQFVEECVNIRLDELERTMYDNKSKEELIAIIKELKNPSKQLELEV